MQVPTFPFWSSWIEYFVSFDGGIPALFISKQHALIINRREHGSRTHLSKCWSIPLRLQMFQPGSLIGQLCSFPSQSSTATSIYIFTTKSHLVILNMQRWVWPPPQHINPTFHSDERLTDIAGWDRGWGGNHLKFYVLRRQQWLLTGEQKESINTFCYSF